MLKNQYKVCSACGTILLASTENYHIEKTCSHGLKPICKKCTKEYRKKYANSIKGIIKGFNSRSKRRFSNNYISDITYEQFEEMMIFFNFSCGYSQQPLTPESFTFDHIVTRTKGGIHHISNIVPCDKTINRKKFTKDFNSWYCSTEYYSTEQFFRIALWQEYALRRWSIEEWYGCFRRLKGSGKWMV